MSDDPGAPRRLHLGSVLIDFLRSAPQYLVVIPVGLAMVSDLGWGRVLPIALAMAAVTGGVAWLRWRRFTYALSGDALVIESGIFSRNRRTIPFERIQDVDIERKLLQRVFGLARVSLETGGAGSDEAALDSVSMAEAERLRAVIRGRGAVVPTAVAEQPDAAPLFAMRLSRVLLFGLFNFSLVWLAVLFGGLQYIDNLLPWDVFDPREWFERRPGFATELTLPLIGAAALAFGLLGIVAGVLRTTIKEFGFTLTEEDGRLRRARGLTTRSEAVIALNRVQAAVIEAGWIRRGLGWEGLELQTLGGSNDEGGRQQVAPFARPAEVDTILATTGLVRPDPANLRQVSTGHVLRKILRYAIPLTAVLIGGWFNPFVWLALLLFPIPLTAALLARRFHRYGRAGGTLAVARGVTTQQLWVVPERNIQAVSIRRSWLQRRLGLATVSPDTAGARGGDRPWISDITEADAWGLAEDLSAGRARPFSAPPSPAAALPVA